MYYINEQLVIFILLQYPNTTNNINTNTATTKIKTRPQRQRFYVP